MLTFKTNKEKLLDGRKIQTLRRHGCRTGERLHIWWRNPRHMHTLKGDKPFKIGVAKCIECFPIKIDADGNPKFVVEYPKFYAVVEYDLSEEQKEEIARLDGYDTWEELLQALKDLNRTYEGTWYVIRWSKIRREL